MTHPLLCLPLFGVGMTEWIIIGAAIMLFFGASKLPKLGKGLGEGIRNFKKGIKGELDDNGNPIADAEPEDAPITVVNETSTPVEAPDTEADTEPSANPEADPKTTKNN